MISLSLAKSNDPRHQQRFAESGALSAQGFAATITRNIWSPIIWKDGVRTKANFQSCAYFVLDIDDGMSLADMVNFCNAQNVSHIIGTTKSHRKEKVSSSGKMSPAADRFRVIFPADTACTDAELYRYNLGIMAERFGCDESATDAARFFYPCTEVVAATTFASGRVCWLPFDAEYVPERVRYERRRENNRAAGALGMLPPWMSAILNGQEVVEADRHKTVLRMGIMLGEIGWDLASERGVKVHMQILKLPLGRHIGAREVERHLENGYRIGAGNV